MAPDVRIEAADSIEPTELLRHIVGSWGSDAVVAHGDRIHPARLPGFAAVSQGAIVGHVSYRLEGERCEITSIDAEPQREGIGMLLLERVIETARRRGCCTVWLTTTNDNLDALRFYQRRGFRLARIRPGAVDRARETLKPELPVIGSYGIPMRDELDLELELAGGA